MDSIELLGVNPLVFATVMVVAYLVGSISPSTLIARARGINIKREGSGNAGTTNALRVLGKKAALATLVIDILKGLFVVLLSGYFFGHTVAMYALLAVMLGHVFPIYFKFKGGKGVATAFGALVGLNPTLGFIALGVVVLSVLISRRMSVGSIAGALSFPILAYYFEPDFIILGTILAIFILFNHRVNFVRLVRGEEPPISFKRKKGEK